MTASDSGREDPIGRVQAADRDRYLAVLHAPVVARDGLFALFALDLELAQVVATTSEPLLGEIRLAWWREQLARLDSAPAPVQPTLAALAQHVLPAGVSGASLEPLEDAHLAVLLDEHFDADQLDRYMANRGGALFAAAAQLLGGDVAVAHTLGRCWALGEFVRRGERLPFVARKLLEALRQKSVVRPADRALRPLAGLARLALADVDTVLAGRDLGPRGSAGRQLRLLRMMLTGR
jgi:phytoene synthase